MTLFSYNCMKKQLTAVYDSIGQESIATPVNVELLKKKDTVGMEKMDITEGKVVVVLVVVEEEVDLTEEVSKIQIGEIHLMI